MRIYAINIDATPLFKEVENFLESQGFRRAYFLANGLFTTPSVRSCYHGRVFDELTVADQSLIELLIEQDYAIAVHEDVDDVLRQVLREQPDYSNVSETECLLKDVVPMPDKEIYGNIRLTANPRIGRRHLFGDAAEDRDFLRREKTFIEKVQAGPANQLAHLNFQHYHDFVYGFHHGVEDKEDRLAQITDSTTSWLQAWDFNQTDALFFIFSDHGDCVDRLTKPKDYLRWCYVKDTSTRPLTLSKSIVSGIDLFPTVLQQADIKTTESGDEVNAHAESFDAPLNKARIYSLADVRYWDEHWASRETEFSPEQKMFIEQLDPERSRMMSATAIKIIDWDQEDQPKKLIQATYYRHSQSYYYLTYDFDEPPFRHHFFSPSKNQFDPIQQTDEDSDFRPLMIELSEYLLTHFPWIENRDFMSQLDSGRAGDWTAF